MPRAAATRRPSEQGDRGFRDGESVQAIGDWRESLPLTGGLVKGVEPEAEVPKRGECADEVEGVARSKAIGVLHGRSIEPVKQ